ncbi:MAG TPA: glycosyltransferase family 4 protein [Mesorhizobium sp.]
MPETGKPPRIAVIVRRFGAQFGGLEAYAENLVRELRHEYDLHVFCQEWESDLPVPHTIVPRIEGAPSWLNLLDFTWRCQKLAKGFDIVHSHENSWLGDVHSVHMMPVRYSRYHHRAGWKRSLSTWMNPRLLVYLTMEAMRYRKKAKRRIVAVSPLTLEQIEIAYRRHPPATIIAPAVHVPQTEMSRGEGLDALGLPHDRHHALLVAHDPARKGLTTLLAALPLVSAKVDLIVVGGRDDLAIRNRALVAAAGQAGRVHIWPRQKDLGVFYAAADVCVFPTTGDAFGMVPLEAASHGCPTIVSSKRHCGFAHYVTPEIDALVLENPTDPVALAGAIDRLFTDPALYERVARNGKSLALGMGWDRAAQSYSRLYQTILAGEEPGTTALPIDHRLAT